MAEKGLRRLSRKDLLEILIDQTKEINDLREKNRNLESELNDRRITISKCGSMAEASLKLNGLFEDADKAARQYLENARQNEEDSRRALEEARKKAEEIIAEAEKIRSDGIREADLYANRVKEKVRYFLLKHPEIGSSFDED